MTDKTPNPGSDEAVAAGCTCPVMDNYRGAGFPYGGETCHYISQGCPIHTTLRTTEDD